ncbi:fimbrillin family protein [Phocaeicola sartorii]|uniref:fimbrillin family protein n=2 Tax=Phocaeicola sartorii TaxID=671267 RepID=UPI002633756D|nr:fimbrillin family protein [Phocaeicola sartorii]
MMNKSNPFKHLAVAVFACLMAASCSDVTDDGTALPDGKYPMTFTAAVDGLSAPDPATRATTDADGKTSWAVGNPVAISMDGGASHKVYKISDASTGAMVADGEANTLYWQKSDETKTLAAWHPVSCTVGNSGGSEVSITDQSSGFGTLENILHAPAQDYTYSNGGSVAFTFRHALAKVKVALKKGDGIEESDLSNATVRLTGYTAGSLGYDGMTGSEGSNGEISPKAETPAGGGAATYTALVIPQQMQGKKFIKVTIGTGDAARDYYYTPTNSTDADLEAGKQYTYTITVKKTGLEVTVTGNGTAWTDTPIDTDPDATVTYRITAPASGVTIAVASGGSLSGSNGSYTLSGGNAVTITNDYGARIGIKGLYDVAGDGTTYTLKSDLLIEYSLADARVGDFYCMSGSTGYLIPGDAISFPANMNCIGIVFKAGREASDNGTYTDIDGRGMPAIHGYVVALQDVSSSTLKWADWNGQYDFRVGTSTSESDWQGYDNCQKMKNGGNWSIGHFPAANACQNFGTAEPYLRYAAPAGSSGWFLPSCGQLLSLYKNRDVLSGQINKLKAINGYESIGWFRGDYYWSSSEGPNGSRNARRVGFGNGDVYWYGKDYGRYVRGVFAF